MSERRAVVIVGSGPTATGAVRSLRAAGISDILVLEREQRAGGVPRHCGHTGYGLHEYRRLLTGPDYAQRLVDEISGAAELRTGHTVRRLGPQGSLSITGPDGSYEVQADAVLLALGAREMPRSARFAGGIRGPGIFNTGALQQFVYLNGSKPANRIVVFGSELVSFSTLLTCRHAGIEVAALVEPGARTTARFPAGPIAGLAFGVPVLLNTRLIAVEGGSRVTGVLLATPQGERRIACDGVVFSGRFVPETGLVKGSALALDRGSEGPEIDEFWRTTDPQIFAAGNLVHPIETAGACFRDGEAAGRAILRHLARSLPSATTRRISVSGALRYLYPQRLCAAPERLLGRAGEAKRGVMRISLDGRVVTEQAVSVLPERRLHLPTAPFRERFEQAEIDLS